jgi:integrase
MANKYIIPYFKKLNNCYMDLSQRDIEHYYQYLEYTCNLSPNTVKKHKQLIHAALEYAKKNHLISENIADTAKAPKVQPKEAEFLEPEDIIKVLEATKDSDIYIVVHLAAYYGFRRSEILGLTYDSVDFDKNTITVNNKAVRIKEDGKMSVLTSDKLKTTASRRTCELAPVTRELLLNKKEEILTDKDFYGNCYNYQYDNYICVDQMGKLLEPDYITSKLNKIAKKLALPNVTLTMLRHSFASTLIDASYSMKDVQIMMGHSQFQTTANTYVHVEKEKLRKRVSGSISNIYHNK